MLAMTLFRWKTREWVKLVSIMSKRSAGVAHVFVEKVLSRLRAPWKVLPNHEESQGAFKNLLNFYQISHRVASREHTLANGLDERMVQTLGKGLREVLLMRGIREWDLFIPYMNIACQLSWDSCVLGGTLEYNFNCVFMLCCVRRLAKSHSALHLFGGCDVSMI